MFDVFLRECVTGISGLSLEGVVAFDRLEWSVIPMCTVLT